MNIFLVNDDIQTEYMIVPILPSEIKIDSPMVNVKFETTNGTLNLYGNEGLKTVALNSFFPNKKYNFDKVNFFDTAIEYVNLIEEWKQNNNVVTLAIVGSSMDFTRKMIIESFETTLKDATGDIYYTLTLTEEMTISLESKVL